MNAQSLVSYERCFKLANAVKFRNKNIECIRETWLNEDFVDNELHLDQVSINRKGRISGLRNYGGLVSIAINETTTFLEIEKC